MSRSADYHNFAASMDRASRCAERAKKHAAGAEWVDAETECVALAGYGLDGQKECRRYYSSEKRRKSAQNPRKLSSKKLYAISAKAAELLSHQKVRNIEEAIDTALGHKNIAFPEWSDILKNVKTIIRRAPGNRNNPHRKSRYRVRKNYKKYTVRRNKHRYKTRRNCGCGIRKRSKR